MWHNRFLRKEPVPVYEVELVREADSELGLTDTPLELGAIVEIADSEWHVAAAAKPYDPSRRLRFICVETPREPKPLKGRTRVVQRRTKRLVPKPSKRRKP